MASAPSISQEEADRLRSRATLASISVAATLGLAKLIAWLLTGSVAVLSSVVDSIADLAASIVTRLTVREANRPADPAHRFGHGKLEPLGALVQAAAILGSGLFVLAEAIFRLLEPVPVTLPVVGIVVLCLSTAATLWLVTFQRAIVRRTGSVGIDADSRNYTGDLYVNAGIITALIVVQTTGAVWVDAVAGMVVASLLLWNASVITRRALDILMDRELPADERARVAAIINAHPQTRGVHDLRTRTSGAVRFIEFHLEMDGHLTLLAAHDVTDEVEAAICAEFPNAEVLVHQEPAGLDDDRLDQRILQSLPAK